MINLDEIKLRPGQKEVVKYKEGKMAVPAVPGAGKTFTLAYLASELIANGEVSPGKILIVTYMNSAVFNFKSRINKFLEQRGIKASRSFEVRTLHSLAMNILRERPDYLLINDEFRVIDQNHQQDLLGRLTEEWLRENRSRWRQIIDIPRESDWHSRAVDSWKNGDFIKLVKAVISHLKVQGLTRDEIINLKDQVNSDSYLAWVCEIYRGYTEELSRSGWLDFDDLIVNAWHLLKEDKELRGRLQKRWSYIFEDEAQDSNLLQEKILNLLAGKGGNLVRVGDSNQAITGTFTASDPQNFRDYCQAEDVEKKSILCSSRSAPQIIDLANYLVKWSRNYHPVKTCREALEEQMIKPVSKDDPNTNPRPNRYPITYKKFRTKEEETKRMAWLAADYALNNEDKTVAVIVPNRYRSEEIVDQLERCEVPFEEVGSISQEQQKTILDLKLAVKYLATPHRERRLVKLINQSFLDQFSSSEHEVIEEFILDKSVEEILYPLAEEISLLDMPDELAGSPELATSFREALRQIRNWLEASMELPPDELVLFLAEDLELKGEGLALAQGIALQVKDELTNHPNWRLVDIVENLPELERSFERFARKLDSMQGFEPKPGVISVLNAHKAKGLEWDIVFLVSLVSNNYPILPGAKFRGENWYLTDKECNPAAVAKAELKYHLNDELESDPVWQAKIDVIKERLRLIYVAVTRAKKGLFLSAYQQVKRRNGKLDDVGDNKIFEVLADKIEKERKKDAD